MISRMYARSCSSLLRSITFFSLSSFVLFTKLFHVGEALICVVVSFCSFFFVFFDCVFPVCAGVLLGVCFGVFAGDFVGCCAGVPAFFAFFEVVSLPLMAAAVVSGDCLSSIKFVKCVDLLGGAGCARSCAGFSCVLIVALIVGLFCGV